MALPPSLILPILVTNTKEIYQEVASYPVVPPEKLWEYWHVYTTTYRRMFDPTASRLENFWWHVMGSDRRYLSGKALAKIYEEISTAPSFTPLRGPMNRHLAPLPRITRQQVEEAGYGTNQQTDGQTEISRGAIEVPRKPAADRSTAKDPILSSSLRPPPPHPILKKSRGPSTSGPRPTARFISPHVSDDEDVKDDDTSSGSMATKGLEMRRATVKSPVKGGKKSTPTQRKFTATSAAKRHARPPLARRPSSQSSVETGAGQGTPEGASRSNAGGRSGSVEQPRAGSLASSNNSTSVNGPPLSAKAAGKRPMRDLPQKSQTPDAGSVQPPQNRGPPIIVQQRDEQLGTGTVGAPNRMTSVQSREADRARTMPQTEIPRAEAPERHPGGTVSPQLRAPTMARSQSNIETRPSRPPSVSASRPFPPSMITPKSTAVTKQVADVSVQVSFDSESVIAHNGSELPRDLPDKFVRESIASRPSSSSLYTPTQASPTPSIFLGRSKSQLTLLLEKADTPKAKSRRDKRGREEGQ